jgi:transcriptional regulator with XRE-family HTH domain
MKINKTNEDFERIAALSKLLLEVKSKKKLRFKTLAKNSGVARCSISKIINGKQDTTFTTLIRLLKAMNIEVTFNAK